MSTYFTTRESIQNIYTLGVSRVYEIVTAWEKRGGGGGGGAGKPSQLQRIFLIRELMR